MSEADKKKRKESDLDKALQDSFPASDPLAVTSPTRSITGDDQALEQATDPKQTGEHVAGRHNDQPPPKKPASR